VAASARTWHGSPVLGPGQRAALDRDGYLVVAGVLDEDWLARLRASFGARPLRGTQHVQGLGECWDALRAHPLLAEAASHVLGPSFFVRDLHGRDPAPGFGGQGLHADWPDRPPGTPCAGLTALWMIDAFTADNGATRVVPGTHLGRGVPRELAQPAARHPDERVIVGAAGGVLLLNGHLWHGATMNRSPGTRRVAQMVVARR
jgi:ectoine hydroxylase-related dioxygenase (phytanoyl-CoA dioxygenase family)